MRIDVGVYTPITIDLSQYNFSGIKKVILTIKNVPDAGCSPVIEREFTEPKVHTAIITPEESLLLRDSAEYDFNEVTLDDKRYKVSDNKPISLRRGCGHCQTKS